jgi:excisionase family DNA binding protein
MRACELLRIPEVATRLGISRGRAYELVRLGFLPAVHLGRQVRISEVQLEKFVAEGGKRLPGRETNDGQ